MLESKDFDFGGKRVLVTGAASGLGEAMAKAFAGHGAELLLADVNEAGVQAVAETLGATWQVYDQSDLASVLTLAESAGAVDVLCNNAGIARLGPLLEQTPDDIQALIATNFAGPVQLAVAVGRGMVERGRGVIVSTSSQLAFWGSAERGVYSATKAGISQFTRAAAAEWAPHGVRVVALAPGRTLTAINQYLKDDPAQYAASLKMIPAGRLGNVEEMAKLTVFLASDAASYVVGETLIADGGFVLL